MNNKLVNALIAFAICSIILACKILPSRTQEIDVPTLEENTSEETPVPEIHVIPSTWSPEPTDTSIPSATSSPEPSRTPSVINTQGVLIESPLTFENQIYTEDGESPPYHLELNYPQSADLPEDTRFNNSMREFVFVLKDQFVTSVTEPQHGSQSTLDAQYDIFHNDNGLISLQYESSIYLTGAAHPFLVSQTFNYDINSDTFIYLDDIFQADSEYIDFISGFIIDSLLKRDIGFRGDESAVAPEPYNFVNWTIQEDWLVFRFDAGHVAAYAAGPQDVHIPFDMITNLLDQDSPLYTLID